jgi:hypothetical protein
MNDISESKKIHCSKCERVTSHSTNKTFENKSFKKEEYFMDSYSMLCSDCCKSTVIYHHDIITDEDWKDFSHKKITSIMELKINEIESSETDDIKFNLSKCLNSIVHLEVTKFELKILHELIQMELCENKSNITQKEFLKLYNDRYSDEFEHLNGSIKQSQLSRSLKNLEKQNFINIVKLDHNQIISFNAANFY